MEVTIEGKAGAQQFLVIKLPIQSKLTPSASGKTLCVASSHGNVKTAAELKGYGPITVGVNAYVKPETK